MPEPTPPTDHRRPSPGPPRPPVLPLAPGFGRPPDGRRPLPDAAAVRRLVVPTCAPPYDDELQAADQEQAALAARPPAAGPPDSGPADSGPDRRPTDGRPPDRRPPDSKPTDDGPTDDGPTDDEPDQRRPPRPGPPDGDQAAGRSWPGQFAQVLAETLAGSRPARQIVPWTTEEARRHIRRLGPMLAAGERPLVRRVLASHPAADVVEMTVIVRFGPRVRALAIRLERDGPRSASPGRHARAERWLCTTIEAA